MNVTSSISAYANPAAPGTQATPERAETQKVGPGSDGDKDDGAVQAAKVAAEARPAPTVNSQGQDIGQLLNTSA